jgi:hypothetical protein
MPSSFDYTLFLGSPHEHIASLCSEFACVISTPPSSSGVLSCSSGGVSGGWHVGLQLL